MNPCLILHTSPMRFALCSLLSCWEGAPIAAGVDFELLTTDEKDLIRDALLV